MEHNYLVFIGDTNTMSIIPRYSNVGYLEYSMNGGKTWNYLVSSHETPCGRIIFLRGKFERPALFNTGDPNNRWLLHDAKNVYVIGDIAYLLDFENPPTSIEEYAFAYTFAGWSQLREGPDIRFEHIKKGCFLHMFDRCNNLLKDPLEHILGNYVKSSYKKGVIEKYGYS